MGSADGLASAAPEIFHVHIHELDQLVSEVLEGPEP
jgi:hypothetical protein